MNGKEEVETLNEELNNPTNEELTQVSGGKGPATLRINPPIWAKCPICNLEFKTDVIPSICPNCEYIFYPQV